MLQNICKHWMYVFMQKKKILNFKIMCKIYKKFKYPQDVCSKLKFLDVT